MDQSATHLVVGATGFVGRALVDALVAHGVRVRAAARHVRPATDRDDGARWVACDVRDPASLGPALDGVECAYFLVHSMGQGARDFRATERRSAEAFVRAAERAGVRRILYLGGVAPRGPASEHLASRMEVGEILRSTRVPALELRASMIVGNGSASWRIVRDLALRLPVMVLPRWLESKSCPIALPDVVTALLDARRVPLEGNGAWLDIPGPDVLTAREMIMTVGRLRGRDIPAMRVPLLTPKLSAGWLKLISGADYHVARELVLGLRDDLLPRDARFWEITGRRPRWSFREAALEALRTEAPLPGVGGWIASREERLVERAGRIERPHHTPA